MTTTNDDKPAGHTSNVDRIAALAGDARAVFEWLRERRTILVLTHERPDGDAFGSLYGAVAALQNSGGIASLGRIEVQLPRRYIDLFPRFKSIKVPAKSNSLPDDVDGILCLDASDRDRVVPANALDRISVCNVDHHQDNSRFGDVNWVDPTAAATAQMLAVLFDAAGWLTAPAADCLLCGMLTDTGGLRFPNTTPAALRVTAHLCECGARYDAIMDGLFFNEPIERRRLEAHLIETAVAEFDGRFLYAVLDSSEIRRRGLRPVELEGLIDVLRSVEGVQIACLIQPGDDAVRLSLRARSAKTPVNEIARQLGGGGHPLAAGVRMEDTDTDEAIQHVYTLVREVINDT